MWFRSFHIELSMQCVRISSENSSSSFLFSRFAHPPIEALHSTYLPAPFLFLCDLSSPLLSPSIPSVRPSAGSGTEIPAIPCFVHATADSFGSVFLYPV